MKLDREDFPGIIGQLDELADGRGYTKIFAMVPQYARDRFVADGYEVEATIPGLYRGTEDGFILGKYLAEERRLERQPELVRDILATAEGKSRPAAETVLAPGYSWRLTEPEDAVPMTDVFRQAFGSYPVPIFDPGYLREQMAKGQLYFGIWRGKELVSLASPYLEDEDLNGELTDFATLPDHRGQGLAGFLMRRMEEEMTRRGFKTAYTFARAYSYGMNIAFAGDGYTFAGTLTNSVNIASGDLESMNVWYKKL
jgi:putative beta-lysine N-acetyltransferase